jgi:hypothetical protein
MKVSRARFLNFRGRGFQTLCLGSLIETKHDYNISCKPIATLAGHPIAFAGGQLPGQRWVATKVGQRAPRSIGTIGGEQPARMTPSPLKPNRWYNAVLAELLDSR